MDQFGQRVAEWQLFYATIAGSSATLVGLLFVALSVNPEAVNIGKNNDLRLLARQTFPAFLYIIGFALGFLVPRQSPNGVGLPLVGISLLGLAITLGELRAARHSIPQAKGIQNVLRHGALKALALGMLIAIGVAVLTQGDAGILPYMVLPMLILLISASLNTWYLLIGVQEASKR